MGDKKTVGGFVGRVLNGNSSTPTKEEKKENDLDEWDTLINGPKEVEVAPTQEMKQDDGTAHYTVQPETHEDLKKLQEESPNGYYDEATNTFHYNDKQTEWRRKLADEDKEKGRNFRTAKAPSVYELNLRNGDFRDRDIFTNERLLKIKEQYPDDEKLQNDIDKELRHREKLENIGKKRGNNNSSSNTDSSGSGSLTYDAAKEIEDYKNIVNKIEDYYKDSIGSGLDDLSSRDKKILALEHIGTTMKNLSKMQPYIGSIYGRQHEEVGPGDEKSMLQNIVETNLKGGLERRNKRMSAALDQQIKMSNFPSDLKMKMSEIANANDLDFAQKKRLLDLELLKYLKEKGIDIDMYKKQSDIDTAAKKERDNNYQHRDYRPKAGFNKFGFEIGAD